MPATAAAATLQSRYRRMALTIFASGRAAQWIISAHTQRSFNGLRRSTIPSQNEECMRLVRKNAKKGYCLQRTPRSSQLPAACTEQQRAHQGELPASASEQLLSKSESVRAPNWRRTQHLNMAASVTSLNRADCEYGCLSSATHPEPQAGRMSRCWPGVQLEVNRRSTTPGRAVIRPRAVNVD